MKDPRWLYIGIRCACFLFFPIVFNTLLHAQTVPSLTKEIFGPGEELTYKLKYGFISAAEGILKVLPTDLSFDGKPTYQLHAVGKTSKAFSVFYNIRDEYNSYIDQKTYLPYFFIEDIKEGKYRRNDKIRFYQSQKRIEATRGNFQAKELQTFDLLSVYYFSRILDLKNIKEGDFFKLSYFLKD